MQEGKEPVMEVRNMNKSFGPTVALRGVTITVRRGEIRGLIGENGSGKSTVSSIFSGMQPADSGEMFLLGRPWHPSSMVDAMNGGVGMIVQESGTVPDIPVAENLFLGETGRFRLGGNRLLPVSPGALYATAQKALDEIGASHIRAEANTSALDMQDRKLVEIAKVWSKRPQLMVVDETTTALSRRGREILYQLMERMQKENRAVVFISHDLEEIMAHCNALTVLRDGKIIRTFGGDEFDADAIRTAMIGRTMEGSYYREDQKSSHLPKTALEARHLTVQGALSDFSLRVFEGEILGIGGLSHCGMHPLGRALYGAVRPSSGDVIAVKDGKEYPIHNERSAMRLGIGYVARDRDTESLSINASLRENVAIGGLSRIARAGHGFMLPWREREYVVRNLGVLSTKYFSVDQPVSELSGGNKQKVVFAKWVGRDSRILILDGPTRGVDIGVKQTMYHLMVRMKEEGKTVVMISEEMTELMGMCDRLIILKNGHFAHEFSRSDGYEEAKIIRYMI